MEQNDTHNTDKNPEDETKTAVGNTENKSSEQEKEQADENLKTDDKDQTDLTENISEDENEKNTQDTEPDLVADLEKLESLNLLKEVLIRMKAGRHPDKNIDDLLKRHLNFSGEDFQGPYIIRLLCTIMMILAFSTLFWVVLWILTSGFGLTYFQKLLSTGMATLVAALAGVAIFQPSTLPDEKILKHAIEQKLGEIRKQIGIVLPDDELLEPDEEK